MTSRFLAIASLLAACSPLDLEPISTECSSSRTCPWGTVCNILEHTCVPETNEDGLRGSFSCTIVDARDGSLPRAESTTDVGGFFGAYRALNFDRSVRCYINASDELIIDLRSYSAWTPEVGRLLIYPNTTFDAHAYPLGAANGRLELISSDREQPERIATVHAALLELDRSPELGESITGFLDTHLVPSCSRETLTCPDGLFCKTDLYPSSTPGACVTASTDGSCDNVGVFCANGQRCGLVEGVQHCLSI